MYHIMSIAILKKTSNNCSYEFKPTSNFEPLALPNNYSQFNLLNFFKTCKFACILVILYTI